MAKAVMIALGKPKAEKDDAAKEYASEAYSALKDGDEEGFVEAFLGAVRACKAKDYDADKE